jgi:hypothetical protein
MKETIETDDAGIAYSHRKDQCSDISWSFILHVDPTTLSMLGDKLKVNSFITKIITSKFLGGSK